MKNTSVVITGLGVITSNSQNASEFFHNCLAGQMGIKHSICPVFDTENLRTDYWGQIDSMDMLQPSCTKNHVYRSRALAGKALHEALEDSGLSREYISSLGNRGVMTLGALSYDDYHILEAVKAVVSEGEQGSLSYLKSLSDLAVYCKQYCGIQGACYNFSSACASGTTAVGAAMELIASGRSDVAIVCGVDSLSQMIAYGFHSLKALSTGLCHPLDENRDGINIGEGCGVLVLESKEHAKKRQADIYAECAGYSLGNEAFHITSPDEDGKGFYHSMHRALQNAGVRPEQLDYINLHGTGTPINDRVELDAISRLYENTEKKPYISSLKTLIGHCMGAAGTLEAILTVLCLKYQRYLPVFRVEHPMKELKEYSDTRMPIEYALSNSFAFAGNTSSVVFAREGIEIKGDSSPVKQQVYLNGIGVLLPDIADVEALKLHLGFGGEMVDGIEITEESSPVAATPTPGISAKKLRGVNHLSRMVLAAAIKAEQDAAVDHTLWEPEDTGSIFSSAYGAVNERLEFGKAVAMETPDLCSPTVFSNISPNAPLGHLCMAMNCKGVSTSMHGASPLLLSKLYVENGACRQLFSFVAEEYSELLASQFAEKDSYYQLPYKESCVQLFLQNEKSETSYCTIGEIFTCSLEGDPLIDPVARSEEEKETLRTRLTDCYAQIQVKPDAVFVMGLDTSFEQLEKELLEQKFSHCPILTASTILGGLQHNSFYANIAAAAVCLREGRLARTLFPENAKDLPLMPVSSILVTGYDACGNYHNVMLYR